MVPKKYSYCQRHFRVPLQKYPNWTDFNVHAEIKRIVHKAGPQGSIIPGQGLTQGPGGGVSTGSQVTS